MSHVWKVFSCVVVIVLTGVRSQTAESCLNPISRTIDYSLTSRKDSSGRWVAEVEMEHEDGERDTGVWRVDVRHSTAGCPESPKVKVTAKFTAPPPKAPPGYEFHRGVGNYKLHADKKTWYEAKATCESEGTHLVVINSEAESAVLVKMITGIKEISSSWAFVGFHDIYREGQYLTVYDEPINSTGFTRWSPGQPDNNGGTATNPGEDCGSIKPTNGGLNDLPCTAKVAFICEQEIA